MDIVDDILAQDPYRVFKQLHGDSDFFLFVTKSKRLYEMVVSGGSPLTNPRLFFRFEPHSGRFSDDVASGKSLMTTFD